MGAAFASLWERTISPPRILGCGETVVQLTTQTWTARATGRSATVDVVELFSFSGGLVGQIRVFQQDTHLLLGTLTGSWPRGLPDPSGLGRIRTGLLISVRDGRIGEHWSVSNTGRTVGATGREQSRAPPSPRQE
jgi:hypothetical protein